MDDSKNHLLGDIDENRVDFLTPEDSTPQGAESFSMNQAKMESPFGGGREQKQGSKPEQINDVNFTRSVRKHFDEKQNNVLDDAQKETNESEQSQLYRIAQTYSDMKVSLTGLGFGARAKDITPADVAPALSDILGTMAIYNPNVPRGEAHEYLVDAQRYAEARKLFMDSCKKLWPNQKADESSLQIAGFRMADKNLPAQDLTLVHSGGELLKGLDASKDGKPPSATERQKRIDAAMDQIGQGLKNRAWREVVYGDGKQSISQEDRQLLGNLIRQAYVVELYKDSLGPIGTTPSTEKPAQAVPEAAKPIPEAKPRQQPEFQGTKPEATPQDKVKIEQAEQELEEQRIAELARVTRQEGMGQLYGNTYPFDNTVGEAGYYPGMGFIKGENVTGNYDKYRELFEVVGARFPEHEVIDPDANKNRQAWITGNYQPTKIVEKRERIKGRFGIGEKTVIHKEEKHKIYQGEKGELHGENGWRTYSYFMFTENPRDTRTGVGTTMNIVISPEIAQKIDKGVEADPMFPDRYFKALFPGVVGENNQTHIKRKSATELAVVDLRKDITGRTGEVRQYSRPIKY